MKAAANRTRRSEGTASQEELYEALRHPIRGEILTLLAERPASAKGLEPDLVRRHEGLNYETIAYHFRKLRQLHCIELVEEDRSRGAPERFYRATVRAVFNTDDMEQLSRLSAESQYGAYAQRLTAELKGSLEAGHFGKFKDESTLLRTPHMLDRQGLIVVGEMMLDLHDRLLRVAAESIERAKENDAELLPVTTGMLAFVRSPDPQD